MKELEIQFQIEGGNVNWNYEEIKKQILDSKLAHVDCKTGQAAYFLKGKCNEYHAYSAQIKAVKERVVHEYMQSIQSFTDQADNLLHMIGQQQEILESCLNQYYEEARKEKEERVISYFLEKMGGYGNLAWKILESDWFWEEDWTAKKISNRKLYQSLDEKISHIILDLEHIKEKAGSYKAVLMLHYVKCHNMRKVWEYYEEVLQVEEAINADNIAEQTLLEAAADYPSGSAEYEVEGNCCQVQQLEEYAQFLGMHIKRTKDNMPKGIRRHEQPDFDSFVAVDLENSGSLGLVHGDIPAEIIEIGAARYEHGELVDTFSMLVNPGRPIVDTVSKLTGITDEMVARQPEPMEAVAAFAQFAGNSILLGHDVKNSDIPFLERTARKCGIHFENEYFDTYEYAKKIQEEEQFEKLRLGELARHYDISIEHLHRAEDDAELAAKLYFAMKNRKK